MVRCNNTTNKVCELLCFKILLINNKSSHDLCLGHCRSEMSCSTHELSGIHIHFSPLFSFFPKVCIEYIYYVRDDSDVRPHI